MLQEQLRQAGEAAEAAAAARAEVDAALQKMTSALQAAEDRCEAAEVCLRFGDLHLLCVRYLRRNCGSESAPSAVGYRKHNCEFADRMCSSLA